MPITNNASYIPTINEFSAHWTSVDATLAAPLMVTVNNAQSYTLATFNTLRTDLIGAFASVIDKLNDVQIARANINLRKRDLLNYLREFTQLMAAYYQGSAFYNAVPKVPSISDGRENFISPLQDMSSLWGKLNAGGAPGGITLPLFLSDGTGIVEFEALLAGLDTAYRAEAAAQQELTIERARRDLLKQKVYDLLKTYRLAVPPRCVQHPELVSTLPALSAAPGTPTPDPVNASAVFLPPDQAKVAYEASADDDLARYELRGNPGEDYEEDDAVVVETNSPEDALEFITNFGLNQPGTQATFKVYVVLNTGREAGSAPMTVSRPV